MAWSEGDWLNPPPSVVADESGLTVVTASESDFWNHTSYGFRHDNGHALLAPLAEGEAMEVDFLLDFTDQFDQAGIMVWADGDHWVKTGVEFADGMPGCGAVVTSGKSDWSTAPVPHWQGQVVTVRVSRQGDALTVRARVEASKWSLVRLAPIDQALSWSAGPYAASPTRGGLQASFRSWRVGPADSSLH